MRRLRAIFWRVLGWRFRFRRPVDEAQGEQKLHCWFDFEDGYYENPYTDEERRVPGHTCMLERDHEGPHEPTRDDQIGIAFSDGGEDRP